MIGTPRAMELAFRAVRFPPGNPLVMAVLPGALTPGTGSTDLPAVMSAVQRAISDGADLVEFCWDLLASSAEVRQAAAALVAATRAHYPDLVVAVTTASPDLARKVCDAGAHLLRGVAEQSSFAVRDVAAAYGAGFVAVRSRGVELPDQSGDADPDASVDAVIRDLISTAESAVARGVPANGALVDPGLDTIADPVVARTILAGLDELAGQGWPVVASLSVDSMFTGVLNEQGLRDPSSLVTPTVVALLAGAVVFRTRDVATTRRALEAGGFGLK